MYNPWCKVLARFILEEQWLKILQCSRDNLSQELLRDVSMNVCIPQVLGADGFAIILSAVNHNSADRNLQFEGFRNLGPLVAFNDVSS